MPLDARKQRHLKAMIARQFIGRAIPVTLTMRLPDGGETQMQLNAIWRVQIDADPTMEGSSNLRFNLGADADVLAIFNAADVSLHQLRATLWATLGPPLPDTQPATRYTLLDVEPFGMLLSRFWTRWTRQH